MNTGIARRLNGGWGSVLKGVAAAVAATVVLAAAFALAISAFRMSDGAVRTVNQLIKLAAICAGVLLAVPRGGERALPRGAAVGFFYMGAGVLLYALLTAQHLTAYAYAADLLMGVAAGGLLGLLRGRS